MSGIKTISPAEWWLKHAAISGFTNPSRSLFVALREALENSLEWSERAGIPPSVEISVEIVGPKVYKVTVTDNGPGVSPEDVPAAFGTFLTSGGYALQQGRSLFGLGIKACLLHAQTTTSHPATVITRTGKEEHKFIFEIDVKKNKANVLSHEVSKTRERGLTVQFVIGGDFERSKDKISAYLEQTAIAAPYAEIKFKSPSLSLHFTPTTKTLPKIAREMPPHPYGADVELIRSLAAGARKGTTVATLLSSRFQRISKEKARAVCTAAGIDPDKPASSLVSREIGAIVESLKRETFMRPSTDCLSPISSEEMIAGIKKRMNPAWIKGVDRKPMVYEGYPFAVSAVLAYGGDLIPPGITLYRFANKVPLLYDSGADVSQKVIDKEIDWKHYRVDLNSDRLLIVVSLVSVKIPYKTAGKEYIADVDEIETEIRLALQTLARDLMHFISARHRGEAQAKKAEIYNKYLPQALKFISEVAGRPMPSVKER